VLAVQPTQLNRGWNNKNTISNGCFSQLAARLARYMQNEMYKVWAERIYGWMEQSRLINTQTWQVYDSFNFDDQRDICSSGEIGEVQSTYNVGTVIAGAAYMYNLTHSSENWRRRLENYLSTTQ
jgi:mannan endo-1,6-alpha-mannosidase